MKEKSFVIKNNLLLPRDKDRLSRRLGSLLADFYNSLYISKYQENKEQKLDKETTIVLNVNKC